MAALNAGAHFLTVYGGHKQAVGLTLDAHKVEEFARQSNSTRERRWTHATSFPPTMLTPYCVGRTSMPTPRWPSRPWGRSEPAILGRDCCCDACIDQAEVTRNGAHLRCVVEIDG